MAEAVHKLLEEMLPELDEYQTRGIFSTVEVKSIVKKRTNFEYALRRRITKRDDYVRYIAYEVNLNTLRLKRKQRLGLTKKNTPAEYAIIRRVHFIYRRLLKKFGSDPKLWVQYFDFCKRNESTRLLGRAFADALSVHPREADMWVEAAKYEFEERANIRSARILMQRGLRLNPKSKTLWLEYFRLENMYHEKVCMRRKLLKLPMPADEPTRGASAVDRESNGERDSDEEDGVVELLNRTRSIRASNGEKGGMEVSDDGASDNSDSDASDENNVENVEGQDKGKQRAGMDMFLRREVPTAVYKNAIKEFPDDIAFRTAFIELYKLFDGSEMRQGEIYEQIAKDFSTKSQAWDHLARREPSEYIQENMEKVVKVYERGLVECTDVSNMYSLYAAFLYQYQDWKACKNVCERAQADTEHTTNEDVYVMWVNVIVKYDDGESAMRSSLSIISAACDEHPTSESVWIWRLKTQRRIMLQKCAGNSSQVLSEMGVLYEHALTKIPYSCGVWVEYMRCLVDEERYDISRDTFERALLALPSGLSRDEMIVQHCTNSYVKSVQAGRDTLRTLRTMHASISPSNFQVCLALEESQTESNLNLVTDMHEYAVSLNPTSAGTWLSYLSFLYTNKKFDQSAKVQARAARAVVDKEGFEAQSAVLVKTLV
eukprot:CFRG5776T1